MIALARCARERASDLGLAALHWSYRLAGHRFAVARLAERDMALPHTVGDVRRWQDLRRRQADARTGAAAAAEAVAPESADAAARWREQAADYRKQAGAIRGSLAELEGLKTLVRTAEAASDDAAAWSAAAGAAETIRKGSGRGLEDEAARVRDEEARRRQEGREAARARFETLNSEWDAFERAVRAGGRVGFADKRSRQYVDRARRLEADPDLDAEAKETLAAFLHEHDVVRPKVVRRCRELFAQWNAVRATARARGVGRFIPPESAEVVAGMRKLAAESPEHLTRRQKETFETIAEEYVLHVERQRTWVMTMRP